MVNSILFSINEINSVADNYELNEDISSKVENLHEDFINLNEGDFIVNNDLKFEINNKFKITIFIEDEERKNTLLLDY